MIPGLVIAIYLICLILIGIYASQALVLLHSYRRELKSRKNPSPRKLSDSNLPPITIQLPLYNERYVVEKLIRTVGHLEYPKDKLEIQVLDDSTDDSRTVTASVIEEVRQEGVDIKHVIREDRTGFKAGALKEGLKSAKGEFIVIFDADFLPERDWLLRVLAYFDDERIGLVQTRWGFTNETDSLLTKIQSLALNYHFTLEQSGRNAKGFFMNFNGTAGMWRKQCILDAGNWEGDTLTEDLDLSFRAQMKEWQFRYAEDVVTPSQLPVVISAAKSQQYRWNKGAAENFQKMKTKLVGASHLPAATRFHALVHLLNSSMFLLILIVAILSFPVLYFKVEGRFDTFFLVSGIFTVSTLIFFGVYWYAYRRIYRSERLSFLKFLYLFLAFFSVAMGFAVNNTLAVLRGHARQRSEFIRTPKFASSGNGRSFRNAYLSRQISPTTWVEGLLMVYFGLAVVWTLLFTKGPEDWGMLPFHLMLLFGFGFVFISSIVEQVKVSR